MACPFNSAANKLTAVPRSVPVRRFPFIAGSYCIPCLDPLYGRMKTVRYLRDAQSALRRHSNVAARLRKAINDYAADPVAHANNVTRLVASSAWRMRVGDFRVIFEETDDEIIVTRIAPRGSAYD